MEAALSSETLVSYHCTASQPRWPGFKSSPLWKPQISHQ